MGGVTPAFSALRDEACIVGPSAIGSEKGIPNSMMSTPPSISAVAISKVASGTGSPAVMKPTSTAFPCFFAAANVLAILLRYSHRDNLQ